MPYIKSEKRNFLYLELENLITKLIILSDRLCAGDLNYIFTTLIKAYIAIKGENYQHYNDVIGALEGAKLELYRRKIAGYEDKKIIENGEVY